MPYINPNLRYVLKNVKILLDMIAGILYNILQCLMDCFAMARRRYFMVNSNLMTIEDLADYLKVTRRTIYDWLKHNKIPALKLVGQWRFKKDKIDDWLEGQSQPH